MTPMARDLSASSTLRSDMHRIRRSLDSRYVHDSNSSIHASSKCNVSMECLGHIHIEAQDGE
jgi:hypothetical protein